MSGRPTANTQHGESQVNNPNPQDDDQSEVLSPSAVEALTRGEYDVSIATAKRYPRSIQTFLHRAESMATATTEIAASCEYAKPVGKGPDGKAQKVKGPSARLAEIVAACYGNIRVQARVISETRTQIIAQGVAHDLETNVAQSTEVTISLLRRDGSRVGNDQVATMCAAACAKARRNATFLVVPLAIVQPIMVKCRQVAAGDAATLPTRRAAMLDWFINKKGVKLQEILDWLNVKAEADIGLEEMADLHAAQNTAKEEGVDIQQVFGSPRDGTGSRFTKDGGDKSPGKQALDDATAKAASAAPTAPTMADCIAAARGIDDERVQQVLEAHEAQSFSALDAAKYPAVIADLLKAKKS